MKRVKEISVVVIILVAIAAIFGALGKTFADRPFNSVAVVSPTFEEIVQKVMNSVVQIRSENCWGSGFAISEDTFLTARHIVESTDYVFIITQTGQEYKSVSIKCCPNYDFAVEKIAEKIFTPLQLDISNGYTVGNKIFAIGTPKDPIHFNILTVGHIAAVHRSAICLRESPGRKFPGWSEVFIVDMTLWNGNSGCPIFNCRGEVIGMFVGGYMPVINYCIPAYILENWKH